MSVSNVEAAISGTVLWLAGASVTEDVEASGDAVVPLGSSPSSIVVEEVSDSSSCGVAVLETETSDSTESVGDDGSSTSGVEAELDETVDPCVLDGDWLSLESSVEISLSVEDSLDVGPASVEDSLDTGLASVEDSLDVGPASVEGSPDTGLASVEDSLDVWVESVKDSLDDGLASVEDSLDTGLASVEDSLDTGLASVEDSLDVGLTSVEVSPDGALTLAEEAEEEDPSDAVTFSVPSGFSVPSSFSASVDGELVTAESVTMGSDVDPDEISSE